MNTLNGRAGMSSMLSETPRAGLLTSLVDATNVRWTYVVPTLLIVWIMSMLDKSNISLVITRCKGPDVRRPIPTDSSTSHPHCPRVAQNDQ